MPLVYVPLEAVLSKWFGGWCSRIASPFLARQHVSSTICMPCPTLASAAKLHPRHPCFPNPHLAIAGQHSTARSTQPAHPCCPTRTPCHGHRASTCWPTCSTPLTHASGVASITTRLHPTQHLGIPVTCPTPHRARARRERAPAGQRAPRRLPTVPNFQGCLPRDSMGPPQKSRSVAPYL